MSTPTDFRSELNESQYEAVTYLDGPSLVIAGAGSGKTRVLTYKIAYLLQHGIHPWNILALTFTNKAAREMNLRISQICQDISLSGMWSGTFHSIFARLLRIEHEVINYPQDFTIYEVTHQSYHQRTWIRRKGIQAKYCSRPHIRGQKPPHTSRSVCSRKHYHKSR